MKLRTGLRQLYLLGRTVVLSPFAGRSNTLTKEDISDIKEIILFTMDRLGDLMCSLPAIHAIRLAFPKTQITVCAPSYIKNLLNELSDIDQFITPEDVRESPHTANFDLAIDLATDYPLKSSLLAWKLGAQYRIGFNIAGRGAFLTHSVKCPEGKMHTVDYLSNLLKVLRIDQIDRQPRLGIKDSWKKEFYDVVNALSSETDFYCIHPGGMYPTQRWPTERFAELADRVIQSMNVSILILGGPGEIELCEEIASKMQKKAINLCGKLSMGGLAAAISSSQVLICNNSGPLHVAVAVGTPTLSTMGPTLPDAWWPIGENHSVIRRDLKCSPCNEGYCKLGTHECLQSISVDEMFTALGNLLQLQDESIKRNS